jgi:hypothetical protein
MCQREVEQQVSHIDLHSPSGFGWPPINKLELQYYSIRHLQQHAGELMERLGSRAGVQIGWVGANSRSSAP